jgi:hypothetical protein
MNKSNFTYAAQLPEEYESDSLRDRTQELKIRCSMNVLVQSNQKFIFYFQRNLSIKMTR